MTSDRPEVTVRPGFSGAFLVFNVRVANPTHGDLRAVRLTPRTTPPDVPLDREHHLIPLLRPKRSREFGFRSHPRPGTEVVAMDVTVEWEDETGSRRGRMDVGSRPVDMTCPELTGPKDGMERWRTGLRGGAAVEVRLRQEPRPEEVLDRLEEALTDLPGELSVVHEGTPRGHAGRVWVRAEGAKGRRAGLLVDVTPDPRTGGSRALVTVTATTEELLTLFYHRCSGVLEQAMPGFADLSPHTLSEGL
jgi:hypothetical protein